MRVGVGLGVRVGSGVGGTMVTTSWAGVGVEVGAGEQADRNTAAQIRLIARRDMGMILS